MVFHGTYRGKKGEKTRSELKTVTQWQIVYTAETSPRPSAGKTRDKKAQGKLGRKCPRPPGGCIIWGGFSIKQIRGQEEKNNRNGRGLKTAINFEITGHRDYKRNQRRKENHERPKASKKCGKKMGGLLP